MKWVWVLVILFLFPVSTHGKSSSVVALADGEYNPFGKGPGQTPNALQFAILPHKGTNNLRAKVSLFMKMRPSGEPISKGRCVMFVNSFTVSDMRDYFIYASDGPEVWLPHVKKWKFVKIAIFWDDHDPGLQLATVHVDSSEGQAFAEWKETVPAEDGKVLQRLSLEDVCRSYTSAELMKGY